MRQYFFLKSASDSEGGSHRRLNANPSEAGIHSRAALLSRTPPPRRQGSVAPGGGDADVKASFIKWHREQSSVSCSGGS